MSGLKMTTKEFHRLTKRDFDNGAVKDEIYNALKDREKLLDQLTTADEEIKRLKEILEVCEGCGKTTKIDDENYLLWCRQCWVNVVEEIKRLRKTQEKSVNCATPGCDVMIYHRSYCTRCEKLWQS